MTRQPLAGTGFCACEPVMATKDYILHTAEFADCAAETAARSHVANLAHHGGRDPAGQAASPAPMLVICDARLATWLIHDGRAQRTASWLLLPDGSAQRTASGRTVLDTASIRALPDVIEGGEPALQVYLEAVARTLAGAGFGVHLVAGAAPPAPPPWAATCARQPSSRTAHVMQPASAHRTHDPDRRVRLAP
jgi:hypothetical protein